MSRVLVRVLIVPAVLACLFLASCSSDDSGSGDAEAPADSAGSAGGESSKGDTKTVSAAGLSFEVPSGYTTVDADDVADGSKENAEVEEMAGRMGMSADQFIQTMSQVELYLMSDDRGTKGFVDNVNVVEQTGTLPEDAQIEQQFSQIGAEVSDVERVSTDAGEAVVLDYTFEIGKIAVTGRGILVETEPGTVVTTTVSATEAGVTADLGDRIVDTLSKAS